MLLKDQHFQYLTPPVNDAQTSKLEINSSNHHAKTSKLVDIDFSAQNQNTTLNKQTSAQIPDISYEHNYATFNITLPRIQITMNFKVKMQVLSGKQARKSLTFHACTMMQMFNKTLHPIQTR